MHEILQCEGLCKTFGTTRALDELTLSLPAGKIIGLLGPNGSGKTTLIKLTAGLLCPSAGSITVCGHAPGPESKALVSYLPERSYLYPWMTVGETLRFFSDFYADFDRPRAEEMLARLGISQEARLKTLSKGTKEKVQLVLVMSRRARLYLLDEPIGGVDPATRDYILHTIVTNYDPEATVLISTHLITDVEQVLDEFLFLRAGKVVMQGNVDDVRDESGKTLDALFREVFKC